MALAAEGVSFVPPTSTTVSVPIGPMRLVPIRLICAPGRIRSGGPCVAVMAVTTGGWIGMVSSLGANTGSAGAATGTGRSISTTLAT